MKTFCLKYVFLSLLLLGSFALVMSPSISAKNEDTKTTEVTEKGKNPEAQQQQTAGKQEPAASDAAKTALSDDDDDDDDED
ncbi:MAG: hypothetical protein ACTSXG_00135 [Alphaproteobacteria bacterium]